jgi:Flp pilus assembly protein TadD
VRDIDPLVEAREALISHVATLRSEAEKLLDAGNAEAALERARDAAEGAPGNAALHELLARAYDATGNAKLAATHRATAKEIRSSLG